MCGDNMNEQINNLMVVKNDSDSYKRVKSLIDILKNMFHTDIGLYINTEKTQHYFNQAINMIMKLIDDDAPIVLLSQSNYLPFDDDFYCHLIRYGGIHQVLCEKVQYATFIMLDNTTENHLVEPYTYIHNNYIYNKVLDFLQKYNEEQDFFNEYNDEINDIIDYSLDYLDIDWDAIKNNL